MTTLSFADLRDSAVPALWDAAELVRVRMADGATFEQVLEDIRGGLRLLNDELLTMPHFSSMIAVQDTPEVEYPVGVSNGVEEATEYSTPVPKRGATTGHMLPLRRYDRALGWTMMYLRDARRARIVADLRSAMTDIRNHWQKTLLTRLFRQEAEPVGATGMSVPLADGGTADPNYVPPEGPDGRSFSAAHDHFMRVSALDMSAVNAVLENLQEHGHQPPFELVAARSDAGAWTALSGFKAPEWPGIVYRSQADRASIQEITDYFGYVETSFGIARLWLTSRVPANYFAAFKSYGEGDPRNPLRVRINPNFGFGWQLVPGTWVNAPALTAVLYAEFGVGIGEDRTNGVACYIAGSGDYVTPTIS